MIVDVKSLVKDIKENIKTKAKEVKKKLLIIQVGDNEASNRYIRGKMRDCAEVGYEASLMKFPNNVLASDLYDFLSWAKYYYNGIILQEPANIIENINGFSENLYTKEMIINLIKDSQDIDGFKPTSKHKPCTPAGIIEIIKVFGKNNEETGNLKGVKCAVVGKGKLVGEPLVPMLIEEGATVFSCNSGTNLKEILPLADIVVTATGVRNLITRDMLKENTLVIDAGINFDEEGKMCGDCDKALYDDPDIYVTSVPGGVGLMTRAMMLVNLSAAV